MLISGAAKAGKRVATFGLDATVRFASAGDRAAFAEELTNAVANLKVTFSAYREEEEQPTPRADEKMKVVSAALRGMRPNPSADENNLRGTIRDLMDAWFKGVVVLETDWTMRQAGSLGSITYQCPGNGGMVSAQLGGISFTGTVTNNNVTLDGFATIGPSQSPDGCTWQDHHHIQGVIQSGIVSYSYSEMVIAKPMGANCWNPCTEVGTVKIVWPGMGG